MLQQLGGCNPLDLWQVPKRMAADQPFQQRNIFPRRSFIRWRMYRWRVRLVGWRQRRQIRTWRVRRRFSTGCAISGRNRSAGCIGCRRLRWRRARAQIVQNRIQIRSETVQHLNKPEKNVNFKIITSSPTGGTCVETNRSPLVGLALVTWFIPVNR